MNEDGIELYWDNLYPSLDVVQQFAEGGKRYVTKVPAGNNNGKAVVAELPKILSDGTARTNRGIPEKCKQPVRESSANVPTLYKRH